MLNALFLGLLNDAVSDAQFDPFKYNSKKLAKQADINLQIKQIDTFSEAVEICQSDRSDAYFLMPFWNEDPDQVLEAVQKIRASKPTEKLIFVDPFAQPSSRFFQVLPEVDFFLKRQCYRDRSRYYEDLKGGMMLTHYLATEQGYDIADWHVGSTVPDGYADRILPGWSLGTSKQFRSLLLRPSLLAPNTRKKFDIFCRMSLGSKDNKEWYFKYRSSAIKALDPLTKTYDVRYSGGFQQGGLVSQRQYFRELRQSRIIFSPFGWGENCWRDFEAICYRGLLMKPSMEHLSIEPNIFIPNETYVPLEWDFSDLQSKCDYYLTHWDEAERIIENAHATYVSYFKDDQFVAKIKSLVS